MTATERVALEPAYVLHSMPWRETSGIQELLTPGHGRISVVVRGMHRPRSRLRSILQPFHPLVVSWSGRGSLYTLRSAESTGPAVPLAGTGLMAGFYINELVMRFLHRGDPHPDLFAAYGAALGVLAASDGTEPVLRRFEMTLLAEAGYGLNLEQEAGTGQAIEPTAHYQFAIERGPIRCEDAAAGAMQFSGAALLAIAGADFRDPEHLQAARRLLRAVLDHYLAGQPLKTREVFAAMRR
jgi:DNA repair protein RecO (recombination protein O)